MILPCRKQQFEALKILFDHLMYQKQAGIKKSLAHELMQPIHQKLIKRVDCKLNGKRGWNLSLTPLQAKSYYAFFDGVHLGEGWTYEQFVIESHLQLIEKMYG